MAHLLLPSLGHAALDNNENCLQYTEDKLSATPNHVVAAENRL